VSARVLVIDDSPMIVELLVKALGAAGVEADSASDLASLDERLSGGQHELVLVDVNMPEMYGDDVVEFLREQRKLSAVMLLYSDLPEDELKSKADRVGADGYITKSAGVESAVAEVKRRLTGGGGGKAGKRILVVDDSPATAKLLEVELKAKGFEVTTAESADAATKIILKKKTRPDLVLLDVRMPNVNGEQFCRFIKSNALFSGIKVILCSAEREDELRRIVRDAGADGYVLKDSLIARGILEKLEG
jgi:DNA-binding response OmpR family regulator